MQLQNALLPFRNGPFQAVLQEGDCAHAQLSLFNCWLQSLFDYAYNTTMLDTEGNTEKIRNVFYFSKIMNAATMLPKAIGPLLFL